MLILDLSELSLYLITVLTVNLRTLFKKNKKCKDKIISDIYYQNIKKYSTTTQKIKNQT